MNWGMISYEVPLKKYPDTYNKQPLMLAALAFQKNHMAIYLSSIYSDKKQREWFETAYRETGKRMDMGGSCVRFKKLKDLPLGLIGEAISRVNFEEFVSQYEKGRAISQEDETRRQKLFVMARCRVRIPGSRVGPVGT